MHFPGGGHIKSQELFQFFSGMDEVFTRLMML